MTQANILLVEDNPADAFFIKEGFKNSQLQANIRVIEDGDEALNFLNKKNAADAEVPPPDLILLDLNLPKMDGISVLKEIKAHPKLRRIPVIVMTSSSAETDVKRSYDNYASGYIIKPIGFQKMLQALGVIEQFWFDLVKLAPHNGHSNGGQVNLN